MKNAPPGFSYPGDPGFNGKSGVKTHFNEWDPRVGFAWDVTATAARRCAPARAWGTITSTTTST